MYKVEFSRQAMKDLSKLPEQYKRRAQEKIDSIALDPLIGKPLEGEYKGLYSFRMWPYRIIYKIVKNKLLIEIIKVPHRQSAYKN